MIEIGDWLGQRRTLYRQLDGSPILADLCECWKDPMACPIDDHAIAARQKELNEDILHFGQEANS